MLKSTKWWMYLPFACLALPLVKWTDRGETYKENEWRMAFLICNLFWTLIFIILIVASILKTF